MNKSLNSVLVVLILVSASLVTAVMAGLVFGQERSVEIGTLSLTVGDIGSVDLTAHNSADPLGAWDIEITYDPDIVSVLECVPMDESNCNPEPGSGSIRVFGASSSGFVGDVTLATITFRCDSEGESSLALMLIVFGEAIGFPPPAESRDGNVVCNAAVPTHTASDTPDSAATPMPVLPETGTGGTASRGNDWDWSIAALAAAGFATIAALSVEAWRFGVRRGLVVIVLAGALVVALLAGVGPAVAVVNVDAVPSGAAGGAMPEPPILVGDLNFDGTINSIDALWVLWLASSLIPVVPPQELVKAADVNEDGRFDSIDATLILQFHAGLIGSLRPGGNGG